MREPKLKPQRIAAFLQQHDIPAEALGSGRPIWKTPGGLVPLTESDVVEMLCRDAVLFSEAYLVETREQLHEDGAIFCRRGDSWKLFPVQQGLARMRGNVLVCAAAEVGKTRCIVLWSLHYVHTRGGAVMIAAANDSVRAAILKALEEQIADSPIAGGLSEKPQRQPYVEFRFQNGGTVQIHLVGQEGSQLRGQRGDLVLGDECALWEPECYGELWRAILPGGEVRLLSTPKDLGTYFYGLVERSKARRGELAADTIADEAEPGEFQLVVITKAELGPPFWTPRRAIEFEKRYGGKTSPEYLANVLGQFGSAKNSVFPIEVLQPCLRRGLSYAAVRVTVDRTSHRYRLIAENGHGEIIEEFERHLSGGQEVGDEIAAFMPTIADGTPLAVGVDLGSMTDPTAIQVVAYGETWRDVFRARLERFDYDLQAAIIASIDCRLGHKASFGLDAGNAGAAVVSMLRDPKFRKCVRCRASVYFEEAVTAYGFAEVTDERDIETGELLLNRDNLSPAGEPQPFRRSNKELASRYLERMMQGKRLEIAEDSGWNSPPLSSARLITGTVSLGLTPRGERKFLGKDDHEIDARRLAALVIAGATHDRSGIINPSMELVQTVGGRRAAYDIFDGDGRTVDDFTGITAGGIRRGMGDW